MFVDKKYKKGTTKIRNEPNPPKTSQTHLKPPKTSQNQTKRAKTTQK